MTDPVLDFLAREQDALADLGDEFAPAIGNPGVFHFVRGP